MDRSEAPEATSEAADTPGGTDDGGTEPAPPATGRRAGAAVRDAVDDMAGRLAERWVPGGGRSVGLLRMFVRRHRVMVLGSTVLVTVGLAGALVVLGLGAAAPRSEAPPPLPAAVVSSAAVSTAPATSSDTSAGSPSSIVVSVVGTVADAGVVTLTEGARVADAISAAGGNTAGAPVTGVNLARKVSDGEQIYVGIPAPPTAAPGGPEPSGAGAGTGKVDINTADAEQLDTLPGVGPATAEKILAWREKHGSFSSVNQLLDVRGIGDATLADMRDRVTVG